MPQRFEIDRPRFVVGDFIGLIVSPAIDLDDQPAVSVAVGLSRRPLGNSTTSTASTPPIIMTGKAPAPRWP